jgi:hypothetical protein
MAQKKKTFSITITQPCMYGGKERKPKDVINDVPADDARYLIACELAKETPQKGGGNEKA